MTEHWARRCGCGHADAQHDDFGACTLCECDAFESPQVVQDQFATLATMARETDTMSEDGLRRRMRDIADMAERWARSSAGTDHD